MGFMGTRQIYYSWLITITVYFQLLKRENCDVNGVFSSHTALQAASQNGHPEVVKILLSHGADPGMFISSSLRPTIFHPIG